MKPTRRTVRRHIIVLDFGDDSAARRPAVVRRPQPYCRVRSLDTLFQLENHSEGSPFTLDRNWDGVPDLSKDFVDLFQVEVSRLTSIDRDEDVSLFHTCRFGGGTRFDLIDFEQMELRSLGE